MDETVYLRVPAVAGRLGKTTGHVHRMIREGKLAAVRRSAHDTRVPIWELESYVASIQTPGSAPIELIKRDFRDASAAFESETGLSPVEWLAAWKRDEIEDSLDSMSFAARAIGLIVAAEKDATPRR